jgi:hypothetical protein
MGCYAFGAAPGTLDLPPEQEPYTLAQAMNQLVKEFGAVDDIGFYGWSSGTATTYPIMVPLLRVGEEYVEEPFSESFAHGATLGEAAALVTTYTNANGAATAESLGALLSQADLLGFKLGELAQGDAILDFAPALRVTGFDPDVMTLSFELENGIDATPAQALTRLGASTSGRVTVLQKATLGGTATSLDTTVQFAPDHGAASFTLETPGDRSFFALSIVPAE